MPDVQEQPTPPTLEEQYDTTYPATEYDQKKFNFTTKEYTRLCAYDAIAQIANLGQFQLFKTLAENVINNYFNTRILVRVGVTKSNEVQLIYDMDEAYFKVYIPLKPKEKKVEEPVKN